MTDEFIEPLFVTIVPARCGGAYEPGEWLAFPVSPDNLPRDWKETSSPRRPSSPSALARTARGQRPVRRTTTSCESCGNLDPFARAYDWATFTAERDHKIERDMLGR